MQNLYDVLLENIRGCVCEISFQQFRDIKRLLVIAVNEERMITKLLHNLADVNSDMEVIVIAQPSMAELLRRNADAKIQVLEWQGRYTLSMVDWVRSKLCDLEPDSFLYFSDQPINLRNRNLLDIAEAFCNQSDFHIFCVDFEGALYEYRDIELYNLGIHLYEDMNRFIELSLEIKEG